MMVAQYGSSQVLRPDYGLFAGIGINLHNSSFTQLGNFASCCPEFTGGSGIGPQFGLFYSTPISGRLGVQFRASYSSEAGSLLYNENSFVADLRDTAKVVNAVFAHDLSASIASLGIAPLLTYRLLDGFDVMAGLRVAAVTSASFVQTETLAQPEDYGAYLGTGRTWVNHDATIPNTSTLRISAQIGARYLLPLNVRKTLSLVPDVQYNIPLNGVSTGVTWTVSQISATLGLAWSPQPAVKLDTIIQHAAPPPPVIQAPPPPTVDLEILGVMADGSTMVNPTVVIEEINVVDLLPLLGHIYFDVGSSVIPERYLLPSRQAFADTSNLNVMDAIHGMPGIVASRMQGMPSSTITLVGTTSEEDGDMGIALAQARAESVRELLNSFGISSRRIKVEARKVPKLPTRSSEVSGVAFALSENRRTEFNSTTASILGPYLLQAKKRTIKPHALKIRTNTSSHAGVISNLLTIKQDTTLVYQNGSGSSDHQFDVHLQDMTERRWLDTPLQAEFEVSDSVGEKASVTRVIPLMMLTALKKKSERIADVVIERYSLILFGFDDVTIDGENARLIDYVRSRVRINSTVRVIGMTDLLGSADYNKSLSKRRASEVARVLNVTNTTIEALGEDSPRFTNDLPEGRAYNRTVIIEIATPTQ